MPGLGVLAGQGKAHRRHGGAYYRIVRYADDFAITVCGARAVYTYPSKKALLSVMAKVRALTGRSRHLTLEDLLRQLNLVLRGWSAYFRHGVSKATFGYLDAFAWHRVTTWPRKRHKGIRWKDLYRRYLTGRPGNRPAENGVIMFDTAQVTVTRYRWRADQIPTPWTSTVAAPAAT